MIRHDTFVLSRMSRERYIEIAKEIAAGYGLTLKQYLRIKS